MHDQLVATRRVNVEGPAAEQDGPLDLPVEHLRRTVITTTAAAALVGTAGLAFVAIARQSQSTTRSFSWLVAALLAAAATVAVLWVTRPRDSSVAPAWEPTEIRELAERLARAEAELAREQELLHQLRATMAGITTSHDLLRNAPPGLSSGEKQHLAEMYDRELHRAERLLAPEPGPATHHGAGADLAGILDPIITTFAARGVSVRMAGAPMSVRACPDAVAEVVHTLLENAVAHGRGRDVTVDVRARGDRVRLRVSDGGPGLARGLAARVFDRGVRGPASAGDGLGLHIARARAAEVGGELWLDDDPTRAGTTFVLDLAGSEAAPSGSCLVLSD
jgi:two-component system OmpR family sensor kinase